jgi:hypothetical protein
MADVLTSHHASPRWGERALFICSLQPSRWRLLYAVRACWSRRSLNVAKRQSPGSECVVRRRLCVKWTRENSLPTTQAHQDDRLLSCPCSSDQQADPGKHWALDQRPVDEIFRKKQPPCAGNVSPRRMLNRGRLRARTATAIRTTEPIFQLRDSELFAKTDAPPSRCATACAPARAPVPSRPDE